MKRKHSTFFSGGRHSENLVGKESDHSGLPAPYFVSSCSPHTIGLFVAMDTCLSSERRKSLTLPWSQRLSFILYWEILRREPLSFSAGSALRSALRVANFQMKEDNIKRKPLGPGYSRFACSEIYKSIVSLLGINRNNSK